MKWTNKKCLSCLLCTCLFATRVQAGNPSFTELLARGESSENNGDGSAAEFYSQAERLEPNNVVGLCILTKRYCDLMYITDSVTAKKSLLEQAMDCASRAVNIDPKNSTAHACMAVCYAKECSFANTRTKITYSRLVKKEAEEAISLNPKEDVAHYLLGRWNYGVANMGFVSRAYVKVVYGGLPYASNQEAVKEFQRAIALAPGHALYYADLAKAYETTGHNNLAVAALKKCVNLRPVDRDDQDAQQDAMNELNSMSR